MTDMFGKKSAKGSWVQIYLQSYGPISKNVEYKIKYIQGIFCAKLYSDNHINV